MGKKTSTTTSQVQIPPEVMARYNAVNARAEEVASKPFQKYGTEASDFVAQINEQQKKGIAGVNAAAGSYQPYIDAATGATVAGMDEANAAELDINKYMSPYIQNVADTTGAMLSQENARAQSGNLGTAISSGAFGGDRAGIAAANLSQQQNLAYGKTMADIYNQGYTQAVGTAQQQQGVNLSADQANLARLTAGGAQLAGLGTTAQQAGLAGAEAQINAGTLEQQTEQAGKTALVNQFMQEQGYPFQVAQFLANIATGTGALSGSTTATTQPAPFFSDRRLKHDVKRIGKTDDGLPIYSFKYKGDENEQTHVGFMADEVEKVKPEAVGVHPTGYKTVDYAKATENSMGGGVAPQRAGEAFAAGGVAGPYDAPVGSQPGAGIGGYVPQAYLPVGELMVADPAHATNAQRSTAQQLAALASLGESAQDIEGTWNWAKDKWGADTKEGAVAAGEDALKAYGGGVGAQYLKPQMGGVAPNTEKSYLTDTLASQDKGDKPKLDAAPGAGGGGSSPAGDIAALAKVGLAIAGIPLPFRYGGAAGYADGGTPSREERERMLRQSEGLAARAASERLPSGLAPAPDRIGAPVSYDIQPSAPDVSTRTAFGTRGSYNPDTGLVRNSYGDVVTGEEGAGLRGVLSAQQEAERTRLADMERAATEQQVASPTAENTQARDAASEAYRAAMAIPTASEARRDYTPPSRFAMMMAPPAGGLVPAAGTPFTPIRQAAGTPFYQEPRQAAGTPFPERELIGPQPLPLRQAAGTPFPLREAAGTPFPLREASGSFLPPSPLASSPRPVARPEGLGVAAVEQPVERELTGVVAPQRPEGLAQAGTPEISDPSQYYRTKILKQESGYRQFDENGNPLTSSAGAVGIGQIMEGTGPEAARLAGVEWDRDRWRNDAEYNAQIGEAYFLDQYRKFGDLGLASAAYNAGPTAVSKALRRAERRGGSYLDYLPEETQNYVLSTSGSPAGAYQGEPQKGGLGRAMLTTDKPYEDRSTLGKMFYNEKDGTLNKNALLSLASGIGGMLSSPSQFFLPSLGLGLQGFAGTYAGLEKQAADIGLTGAQERQTQVLADTARLTEIGGSTFISLGNGKPPIPLWDYIANPEAYSTGDPKLDAQILQQASQKAAQQPQASGVFATPEVQTLIEREADNAKLDTTSVRAQSTAIENAVNASAAAARSSIPSILMRADAVAAVASPDAAVRAGVFGPIKQSLANYFNDLSATVSQFTGRELPRIEDPNGGDAAANAQIILKDAIASGIVDASGSEELQLIMQSQPDVALTAEANSKLMAGLMVAGRADIRRSEFMRDYKNQPGNTFKTVIDAGQAFQETYGEQINAEKAVLKELIHYGSTAMPEEWKEAMGDYATPMEFLMTPGIPEEAKSEFILRLLPSLGIDPNTVAALNGPSGMYIGSYFGG